MSECLAIRRCRVSRWSFCSIFADVSFPGTASQISLAPFSSSSITKTLRTWRYVTQETYECPEDNKDD